MKKRASGILMHITSLPSPYGVGTMGQAAYDFVDFLEETKQTYWQLLPLTTTSYGDSPYQSFSAVAGNTHLIDLDLLVDAGWLSQSDLEGVNFGDNPEKVDYARIYEVRRPILEKAVAGFMVDDSQEENYNQFERDNASWLGDYADFMAIKEHFGNVALQEWPDRSAIVRREDTLASLRAQLSKEIFYHKVIQYFFFSQWEKLRAYAKAKGIEIIGDMPIYVSADSVEVWTKPELFKLDGDRRPLYLAGCPADDFSEDGQLWGNPIYDWAKHAETGYAWWIYRIEESFKLYDYLRIDHFKGFSDYWEINGKGNTATDGTWQPGPYTALFEAVKSALGEQQIIAEDLGYIDDKAKKLLAATGFPGMKVLQFGFYDTKGESIDAVHNCVKHGVAYTGTHDNEVINGWYENLTEEQATYVDNYIHRKDNEPITRAMLRTLFATVSDTAIVCMQDLLDLPADSRMNTPSTVGGNWEWRMTPNQITQDQKDYLLEITELYNRARREESGKR